MVFAAAVSLMGVGNRGVRPEYVGELVIFVDVGLSPLCEEQYPGGGERVENQLGLQSRVALLEPPDPVARDADGMSHIGLGPSLLGPGLAHESTEVPDGTDSHSSLLLRLFSVVVAIR
jgi:hypothetical protein